MKQLPTILIVDDLEENLFFLETVLKKVPVNIIAALSGYEALEKIQGVELALAIIDVRMPGMNGYELAVKMNFERSMEKVPIIFLTANYFSETELSKGYDSGAVDYIFKPFDRRNLLSKIGVFIDLFNQKQTILNNAKLLKGSADELSRVIDDLRISEEKYRSYIDNAPDGVYISDETGKFFEINKAACSLTGYPKEELLSMSVSDLLPVETREANMALAKEKISEDQFCMDTEFLTKSGEKRWLNIEVVKLSADRFLGFAKDITERKRIEEELRSSLEQLRLLAEHIEKTREDERVAISRELHDDLGQALTAVKSDLSAIQRDTADIEEIAKISKVSALVTDTIKTVQRITTRLRPEIIDDLGLEAAIEWYTSEFARRNQVEILLDFESGLSVTPDASHILYRVIQESLTNIARHSKATQVDISLCQSDGLIQLTVSDNGIGISESAIKSRKSFGLISMKERAASLGGTFEIVPELKYGTTIRFAFPIKS